MKITTGETEDTELDVCLISQESGDPPVQGGRHRPSLDDEFVKTHVLKAPETPTATSNAASDTISNLVIFTYNRISQKVGPLYTI